MTIFHCLRFSFCDWWIFLDDFSFSWPILLCPAKYRVHINNEGICAILRNNCSSNRSVRNKIVKADTYFRIFEQIAIFALVYISLSNKRYLHCLHSMICGSQPTFQRSLGGKERYRRGNVNGAHTFVTDGLTFLYRSYSSYYPTEIPHRKRGD